MIGHFPFSEKGLFEAWQRRNSLSRQATLAGAGLSGMALRSSSATDARPHTRAGDFTVARCGNRSSEKTTPAENFKVADFGSL
jgi:hypothetical protein